MGNMKLNDISFTTQIANIERETDKRPGIRITIIAESFEEHVDIKMHFGWFNKDVTILNF